jgi:DNA-binding winged helix-turn-helix (wHTH) protein
MKAMTPAMLYTTISTLRHKLHVAGLPFAIRTVRSRGYALADDIVAELWH